MGMTHMRDTVKEAYPSEEWKLRVSRMADRQVVAIYFSILERKERKQQLPPDTDLAEAQFILEAGVNEKQGMQLEMNL